MDKLEDTPYCPICSGCGEEGCCTPLNCSQDINGSYCLLNLKHLKFGYKMYDEISNWLKKCLENYYIFNLKFLSSSDEESILFEIQTCFGE
jgi:hypothetical protein